VVGPPLSVQLSCLKISIAFLLSALAGSARSQTYQVSPDPSAKPDPKAKPVPQADQANAPEKQLGWGSNIDNARLARAAQLALQRGDHALALDYAQRAAQSAPNDPQLWFLLGYAARLGARYGQSVDAYQKGLRITPSSLDGLSGLAQTYSLMGRSGEAERLIRQVLASDPNRRTDLFVLGDLYLRSGDYTGAVEWLGRAERIEPAAQSELLLAVAYEHLNQSSLASHFLELARTRAPNNPDVQRSLADFYRKTGNYGKAIDALKAIRNPKPDVVAELAFTYSLNGNLEESSRLYIQAANSLPRDLGLQLSAAQAQIAVGSVDRATVFLDRASKLDPDYYRLHAIRGAIATMQDRDSDAVREYSAAVAHLPASPVEGPLYGIQLHMDLLVLYRNLDQADLAAQQLGIAQTRIAAVEEGGVDRAAFLRLRALIRMNADQVEAALNDIKDSLALSPRDPNSLQLNGDLLMKLGRTEDAIAAYKQVLAIDPRSRFALTSLGYASRAAGRVHDAEKYFTQLAREYPSLYVPYLALGDMYTAVGYYKKAQTAYAKGYTLAPQNGFIVAGGMGAAIESHDLPLAGDWLRRVRDKMAMIPQILREKERYFSFTGDIPQSAAMGREAIKVLPRDRDVVVYLGYDLLHLEQFEDLLALTKKYWDVFPKEPDLPLLAGYVHKHQVQFDLAVGDFTEALKRDPGVVTAYVNRGFVLNDLRQPGQAASDFERALSIEPKNGEAHLGLAFSELNLRHLQAAVRQTQLAEEVLGDSEVIHIIRATAYGRQGLLTKSAAEYRSALKFDPDNGSLYLGLGGIFLAQRHYREAIVQLQTAQKLLPENPSVYAQMARASANLQDREQTLRYVQLAENFAERNPVPTGNDAASQPGTLSDIYISTGEVLSTLGDQQAAMERFKKALLAPNSNRVGVRLAIARLMAQQEHTSDAERQVALAQMEADAGDTVQPTGDQYVEAADTFQKMHEYDLSQSYLQRARSAGASDAGVRVALANTYLGLGETKRAAAELAAVKQTDDSELNYQYLLAKAAVYQQEHRETQAISAFAAAASVAGEDQTAEQNLLQAGANEGFRLNPKVSVLSNLIVQPIFEDSTVYVLDSKLNSPSGPVPITDIAQLPPPRSSLETNWINAFHLHLGNLPTAGGFFQIRNARGVISVPATSSIVHRSTTDYSLNFGLDPTIHLGTNVVTLNSGVQGTIRRDSLSPVQLNQNLFRAFTYFTTSSFFNAISVNGFVSGEMGPFTDTPVSERSLSSAVNFRIGAPWSKTALVTGWGMNHQRFPSSQLGSSENYYTSSYIGLTHRFTPRLGAEAIVEDLRAWRVVPFSPIHSAISQALRPAATIDFSPTPQWSIQASTSYESTRGFHVYDINQNGLSVSYSRPLGRSFNDQTGEARLKYPIRVSAGIRQETFLNFSQGHNLQFRPYVSISIF